VAVRLIPAAAPRLITVSGVRVPRLELNGRAATLEQIWELDLSNDGHFTAMQVRGHKTVGLDFHLARLDAATQELFGVGLESGRIRGYLRHALADTADASVRVNVFRSAAVDDISVMVSVRPPAAPPAGAQSLQTVQYQRPFAHIKRASGFGQSYYGSLAHGNGFDEALFVGPGGAISEGSTTNIGFIDGDEIVWPAAPALRGVMMQVLQRELSSARLPWRYEAVHVSDLASFDGAFVTNSRGMATVARIDGLSLPADAGSMRSAKRMLAAAPYDAI
jgi:branched-subunit amino acid aminotransferase/4-amino-4-deoxychorismate lyase